MVDVFLKKLLYLVKITVMTKNMGFLGIHTCVKSRIYHILAHGFWSSYLFSLSLSFLSYQMKI